jgi:DNA-binding winged helix-turn-helix (wHTH) protein
MLTLLVADAGRVVTKKELHERLWPDSFVSDATLVGLVKMLRRTLDDHDARAPIIRTSHGVGYAFVAPIERRPSDSEDSHWVRTASRRILLDEGERGIGRNPGFRRPSRRRRRVTPAPASCGR